MADKLGCVIHQLGEPFATRTQPFATRTQPFATRTLGNLK